MLSPFKPFVMQNKPQRLLNVSFRVQSGELCVRKGRGRGGVSPNSAKFRKQVLWFIVWKMSRFEG